MTISLQRALEHMAWANQEIYKLIAELPDEALDSYATDPEFPVRETTHWLRSTIITQAVHHSIEHRAHAVSALEARGYKKVDLDDFDVWGYEISQR